MLTEGEVDDAIYGEIHKANRRYGPFRSSHEGLGVLVEECDELRDAIHRNDIESIRTEAIQVAAVATRVAYSMLNRATVSRSKP